MNESRENFYIFVVDLKNFEIISIISNYGTSNEGYFNPFFFNKIYNGLGVQKYL